jgi:hypothetical protein
MIEDHWLKVSEQLSKGNSIGKRGTPVVSFWQMRDKWKKYGDYWELWGQDGDLEQIPGTMEQMAPAELKLIYFRIPNSNMVCQLAYEHDPAEVECGRTGLRRHNRIAENLRQGLTKAKEQVA